MALSPLRHTHTPHTVRGFTLVEMMVVMAIFVVISTVTLAGNSRFGGNVTLETLAYDIALSVRQAQVYGIAVRRFDVGGSDFSRAYGIHIDSATPTTYQLFADISGNGLYACPEADPAACELVQNTTLQGGFTISDLCVRPVDQPEMCGMTSLNIVFKRPEPDAFIRTDGVTTYERARIVIRSPQGSEASVLIELAGQISVQ